MKLRFSHAKFFGVFCGLLSVAGCQQKLSLSNSAGHVPAGKINQSVRVIYGEDYRQEPYDNDDSVLQDVARSTAALVNVDRISSMDDEHAQVHGPLLSQLHAFCSGERFIEQVTGAICSGFLVAPDIVVTAGHCIQRDYDCKMMNIVFDYRKQNPEDPGTTVLKSNVYNCSEVIHTQMPGGDFAVIRLSRPVTDRDPLPIRSEGAPLPGDPLAAVGFPSGVPMKLVSNGFVRNVNATGGFLLATLDLFKGNSGSPVVNSETGVVEGIVADGETDYVFRNGCYVSNVCPVDGCKGETISLAADFLPFIQQTIQKLRFESQLKQQ